MTRLITGTGFLRSKLRQSQKLERQRLKRRNEAQAKGATLPDKTPKHKRKQVNG